MEVAEVSVKPVGFLEIIKMTKLIYNLAKSLFKASRPLLYRFFPNSLEYGIRMTALKLDETKLLFMISKHNIGAVII